VPGFLLDDQGVVWSESWLKSDRLARRFSEASTIVTVPHRQINELGLTDSEACHLCVNGRHDVHRVDRVPVN